MPPKKSSRPLRLSTKDKRKASDNVVNAAKSKSPRTSNMPITRTIHQRVLTQPTMVADASPRESPSALTAHLIRVQRVGSHTPAPGYGLPTPAMPPAQWWDPWGPPPNGHSITNSVQHCQPQQHHSCTRTIHHRQQDKATSKMPSNKAMMLQPTYHWWPLVHILPINPIR